MKKTTFLLATGIGYVLGAKAGRERYEQIKGGFDTFRRNPKVQATAHQAADVARDKAPVVKDKLTGVAGAAAEKVRPGSHGSSSNGSSSSGSSQADLESQLNPENVALQDDPYPKGDLP